MRIGFIGLSSPSAYYYSIRDYHPKHPWSWHPILESPQGLMTLFDELWFLHRSLCPITMWELPFVKFINEDIDMISKIINYLYLKPENFDDCSILSNYVGDETPQAFVNYSGTIQDIYGVLPGENNPIDNHSREFEVFGLPMCADSNNRDILITDLLVLQELERHVGPKYQLELITNRFTSERLKYKPMENKLIRLSEGITIKDIPVIQSPEGPRVRKIDKLRENPFIDEFRSNLEVVLKNSHEEDIKRLISQIEKEYQAYAAKAILDRSEGSKVLKSISRNALTLGISSMFGGGPFAGLATNVAVDRIEDCFNTCKNNNYRWTDFIAHIRSH